MSICLSPNGWNAWEGDAPGNRLLVGTIDGVFILERIGSEAKWSVTGQSLKQHHISSLVWEPRGDVILAGTHGQGLHLSGDHGESWQRLTYGVSKEHIYCVAYAYQNGRTVLYAGTEPVSLFRSVDYGKSWEELPEIGQVPGNDKWTFPAPPHFAHTKSLTVCPSDPHTLYAAVEQGALLKSVDGGMSWAELRSYESPEDFVYHDVHQVVLTPSRPERIYLTSGCGLYRSDDSGDSWVHLTTTDFQIGYPDQLVIPPREPDMLFMAGAEHNPGTWFRSFAARGTVVRSTDGGRSWQPAAHGLLGDGRANIEALGIASHPDGFTLFAGNTDGQIFAMEDNAQSWAHIGDTAPVSKSMHFVPLQAGAESDERLKAIQVAIDSKIQVPPPPGNQ